MAISILYRRVDVLKPHQERHVPPGQRIHFNLLLPPLSRSRRTGATATRIVTEMGMPVITVMPILGRMATTVTRMGMGMGMVVTTAKRMAMEVRRASPKSVH